jgi:hypothetical protein
VIEKYVDYLQLRKHVVEEYNCGEDETVQTSLRYVYKGTGPTFDLPEFLSANPKEKISTRSWTKALEGVMLILGISIGVVLCSFGLFFGVLFATTPLGDWQEVYLSNSTLNGLLISCSCLCATSAVVFAILFLVLIGVAAYYVNRRDRGTHLSRKLRATAEAFELEAGELEPLATFVVPPKSTPGPVDYSIAGVL